MKEKVALFSVLEENLTELQSLYVISNIARDKDQKLKVRAIADVNQMDNGDY
ncbi:hypothetical protein [Paenibacillus endoradicis]|uniref:hypothetical protein n=1 Tax=Paenibacillus endoradicis TaxID=2972487 RepID=UPI0021599204|nr:hypothetical protein [Paenibacillus endoradicis]MCR8659768.1 hypothetical protein [Paenibacillus endoradicis]